MCTCVHVCCVCVRACVTPACTDLRLVWSQTRNHNNNRTPTTIVMPGGRSQFSRSLNRCVAQYDSLVAYSISGSTCILMSACLQVRCAAHIHIPYHTCTIKGWGWVGGTACWSAGFGRVRMHLFSATSCCNDQCCLTIWTICACMGVFAVLAV